MPARSFKKLVIALGGTFPGLRQGMSPYSPPPGHWLSSPAICTLTYTLLPADLKELVEKNGASFSATVTEDCTHLVTTEKDVEKQTSKCECALGKI